MADVLSIYDEDVASKRARPEANKARLRRLLDFFGDNTLADLNRRLCRSYAAKRGSEQAASLKTSGPR